MNSDLIEEMNNRLLKQSHTLIHMDTLMQTLLMKLNLLTEQHATTLTKLSVLESKVSTSAVPEPEITVKMPQSQYLKLVSATPQTPSTSIISEEEQSQIRNGMFSTATASIMHRTGLGKMAVESVIEAWRFVNVKTGFWIPLDAKVKEAATSNKILAIKELRGQTGCCLLDAKNSVENWMKSANIM